MTGVVLLSAAQRLHRYQDAFGFTRLRLVVDVAIIWIAVVLVLVCVAGVLWRAGWLPRAVLASAVIALLALNVVNADAFVARRNVARYAAGDAIDTFYLAELGADAVPELDRLPEPARSCALRGAATRLDRLAAGGWRGANLARARARDVLAARPAGPCTTVDGRSRAAAAGARSRPALVLRRPNGYRPERAAKPQAERSEPISQSSEGGPGTPPLVSGPALGDLGAAGVAAPIGVSAHLPGGAGSGHVRVCYRTPFGMRLSPSGNLAGPLGVPMTTTPLVEGRPLDDSELVARARSGDVRAYEDLVRRHQDVAFRVAQLVAGNAADAEDAAQEAMVKAYYALDRFREDAPFRPWLLRIVANEASNRRRSSGRRAQLALAASAERSSGDVAPSPEESTVRDEEQRQLVAALNRLKEPDRLVIGCRYLLELSEAETAEALGWRVGTVKSRLSRALPKLRAELGADSTTAAASSERRADA